MRRRQCDGESRVEGAALPHRHLCALGVVVLAHCGAFPLVVVAHVDGGGADRAAHARQAGLGIGRRDGASLSYGRWPTAQRVGPCSRRTNTKSAKTSNDLCAPATPVVQPATAMAPSLLHLTEQQTAFQCNQWKCRVSLCSTRPTWLDLVARIRRVLDGGPPEQIKISIDSTGAAVQATLAPIA
jgi:hypothetical protein